MSVLSSPQEFTDEEFGCTTPDTGIVEMMTEHRMFDASRHGSDFPPKLEPAENTFFCSPHEGLSGFSSTDIAIQRRQRGVDSFVPACIGANRRIESRLRDAVENGNELLAVTDVTAAAEEALAAAHTNYGFIAHGTATTTDEVVGRFAPADAEAEIARTDGRTNR